MRWRLAKKGLTLGMPFLYGRFMSTTLAGHYPGSKGRLFPQVWELVPPHRHHVVLFGGIGAELCAKPRPSYQETMIDRNDDVINAFRVLRDRQEEVISVLEWHMFSERDFKEQVQLLRTDEPDQLKRATAFFLVAMQSTGVHDPTCPVYQSWRFCRAKHRNTQGWVKIRQRLAVVAQRFRAVQLPDSGRDWSWAVATCDSEDTLFTADPPYILSTLRSATKLYKYEMTDYQHEELLLGLRKVKGFALVFGFDHKLYRTLLYDWNMMRFPQVLTMSPKETRPVREHLVWRNW